MVSSVSPIPDLDEIKDEILNFLRWLYFDDILYLEVDSGMVKTLTTVGVW